MQVVLDPKDKNQYDLSFPSMHISEWTLTKGHQDIIIYGWTRHTQYLTDGQFPLSELFDGLFSVAFSSLHCRSCRFSSGILYPRSSFKPGEAVKHCASGLTVSDCIDVSAPSQMIPGTGNGERAISSSLLHCTSRVTQRQSRFRKGRLRTMSFRIPIRLILYNRTRRLPPEARADPLTCFLHIYEALLSRSGQPIDAILPLKRRTSTSPEFCVDVSWNKRCGN